MIGLSFCSKRVLTESEALAHQAAGGHVLLGLDLSEVEGAGEHQHVDHDHEAGQESDGHLRGHALRRLNVVQLRLCERQSKGPT